MNTFLILIFLFFIGSSFGWCLETLFRRFCKSNTSRKWINPGLLTGPYIPIYGFGLCTLYLLAELEFILPIHSLVLQKIIIIICMAIAMTLLELIAGLIFVKGMNLKLWDYSDKPLNFMGIICPEFTFYWFVLAMIYYFLIHPKILYALEWFASNLAFSFVLGMFFGVITIDIFYSLNLAAKIRRFASENNISVYYDELKTSIRKHAEERAEKYRFLFAFRSKLSLHEHLKNYLKNIKNKKNS